MTITKHIRFMDNQYLTTSNTTASSEEALYPWSNALNDIRSKIYKPTSNIFDITIDLGINLPVTFIGIVGPKDSVFSISDQATVTLQGNNINDFVTPPFDETLTVTQRGIFGVFDDESDASSYRYWKLSIDDNTNPSIVNIGYIYLGDHIPLIERTISKGFGKQEIDPSIQLQSQNGTKYFDERPKSTLFSALLMSHMDADERRLIEQFFYDFGRHKRFFCSLDPSLLVSNSLDEMTRLFNFEGNPSLGHNFDDVYTVGFSLRESI